jgi:hypothetical protein
VEKAAKNFGGAREKDEFNFIMEPEAAACSLLGYEFNDQFKVGFRAFCYTFSSDRSLVLILFAER